MSGKVKGLLRFGIIILLVLAITACSSAPPTYRETDYTAPATPTPIVEPQLQGLEDYNPQSTTVPVQGQPVGKQGSQLLFYDDFSNTASGWNNTTDTTSAVFSNYDNTGCYRIGFHQQTVKFRWVASPGPEVEEFALETTFQFNPEDIVNQDNSVALGLVFGHQHDPTDKNYEYLVLLLGNNSKYRLVRWNKTEWNPVTPTWQSTEIDLHEANKLRIEVLDGEAELLVNGSYVDTLELPSTYRGGKTGLFAILQTDNPYSTEVRFDDYALYSTTSTVEPQSEPVQVEEVPDVPGSVQVIEEQSRQLSAEEVRKIFDSDPRLLDLARLAQEQGYTNYLECGNFPLNNGKQANACLVSKEENAADRVITMQFLNEEGRPMSMLVRKETQPENAIVLYDRGTEIRITETETSISKLPGPELVSASAKGLAAPNQDGTCTTGWEEEYRACTSGGKYSSLTRDAGWCGAAIGGAIAACWASTAAWVVVVGCAAGIIAVLGTCGGGLECLYDSTDDPPVVKELVVTTNDDSLCSAECVNKGDHWELHKTFGYQLTVIAEDDREPQPQSVSKILCPPAEVEITVQGCSGPSAKVDLVANSGKVFNSFCAFTHGGGSVPIQDRPTEGQTKITNCPYGCRDGACLNEPEQKPARDFSNITLGHCDYNTLPEVEGGSDHKALLTVIEGNQWKFEEEFKIKLKDGGEAWEIIKGAGYIEGTLLKQTDTGWINHYGDDGGRIVHVWFFGAIDIDNEKLYLDYCNLDPFAPRTTEEIVDEWIKSGTFTLNPPLLPCKYPGVPRNKPPWGYRIFCDVTFN